MMGCHQHLENILELSSAAAIVSFSVDPRWQRWEALGTPRNGRWVVGGGWRPAGVQSPVR